MSLLSRAKRSTASTSTSHDDELRGYVAALSDVAEKLGAATSTDQAITVAMDSVRTSFACNYASCWWVDAQSNALVFRRESGAVGEAFQRVTREATFPLGVLTRGRVARRVRDALPDAIVSVRRMWTLSRMPFASRQSNSRFSSCSRDRPISMSRALAR